MNASERRLCLSIRATTICGPLPADFAKQAVRMTALPPFRDSDDASDPQLLSQEHPFLIALDPVEMSIRYGPGRPAGHPARATRQPHTSLGFLAAPAAPNTPR